jgi:hypothetical protein
VEGEDVAMPFKSEAQRRYMHMHEPDVAERWEKHTSKKRKRKLPYHVAKRMPGESGPEAWQRHQRQAQAGLMLGAAVPAVLALRSGKMASTAGFAGKVGEQSRLASSQLKHAATATALTGLAGGVGAAPVPHRVFAQNPKRNKKPKISYQKRKKPLPARGYTRETLHKQKSNERTQHYGRMAGVMGTLGATAGTVGGGSALVGHLERRGKDPMGFTARAHHTQKPLGPAARTRVLTSMSDAHKFQAKTLGGAALGAAGLAGAYKYKQHKERQLLGKAFNVQQDKRTRRASDVGLGAAGAGVSGLTLHHGMRNAKMLNRQANIARNEARGAHALIAGKKLGEWDVEPKELAFAHRKRAIGMRVMSVKKPAAALTAGAAVAGGAGLYELGHHAVASAHNATKKPATKPLKVAKNDQDAFGIVRPDLAEQWRT